MWRYNLDLSSTVYIQGASNERNNFDVREIVRSNDDIVLFIVAAHSHSGFDTAAPYHGLGKMAVVKRFKNGKKLSLLEQIDSNIDDVIKKKTLSPVIAMDSSKNLWLNTLLCLGTQNI